MMLLIMLTNEPCSCLVADSICSSMSASLSMPLSSAVCCLVVGCMFVIEALTPVGVASGLICEVPSQS